ncbi:MAG TPA: PEP-CTERM sorting domain-containing protein, partial [Phycisphaerae bacterium]|nr:PEP-CTERM sorting domain-containing protein [Phycisphaerae bacterium]
VGGGLRIGERGGSTGVYTISGGALTTAGLYVGAGGKFRMAHPSAAVTVTEVLSLGPGSTFEAVYGTEIHMAGADLINRSTDWMKLATSGNLTLIFEGGMADVSTFEVAGWDWGPVPEAYLFNITLETLQLGGAAPGRIRLVDDFDNMPGEAEALYVRRLVLNEGACIELNGLNLYYLDDGGQPRQFFVGDANLDGQVGIADLVALAENYGITQDALWARGDFNGDLAVGIADLVALADHYGCGAGGTVSPPPVPEPTALALLTSAGIATLLRRRRRSDTRKTGTVENRQ